MPPSVVDDLPLLDRPAVEGFVALQESAPRGVHFHFHGDAQFLAVAEHGLMKRRNACRTGIEILPLVKKTLLDSAVGELYFCVPPNRPVAPSGPWARLEHSAIETGLAHFIGSDQPCDSRAQDRDFGP